VETVYYNWVKACIEDGCSAFSDFDTGWHALPAPPKNLQTSDGLYINMILVTWNSSFQAEFYQLYRAESPPIFNIFTPMIFSMADSPQHPAEAGGVYLSPVAVYLIYPIDPLASKPAGL
jgi:hypothetical protein